jgi:glycogen operon protein
MHVDGFRFDLAAALGEVDGDPGTWDPTTTVLADIVEDPILQQYHTRLIAEPWSLAGYVDVNGNGMNCIGRYPAAANDPTFAWSEWNGAFRDWWRNFINSGTALNSRQYDGSGDVDAWQAMAGTPNWFLESGRNPWNSVNSLTVHDGYTLYDLFSFDDSRNACGPLNPVCCDDPYSVWCDLDIPWAQSERNWGDEWTKRQNMRAAFTAMLLARGTPLINGGDEWMRTQYGNNNAYSLQADNAYNWFRWGEWTSTTASHRRRMFDFVSKLIAFRKAHAAAFAPGYWDSAMAFEWKNAQADVMTADDWSGRHGMIHYSDANGTGEAEIAVLVNFEASAVTFALPTGPNWALAIDTQPYYDTPASSSEPSGYFADNSDADPSISGNIFPSPGSTETTSYTVEPGSIAVFVEQP